MVFVAQTEIHLVLIQHRHAEIGQSHLEVRLYVVLGLVYVKGEELFRHSLEAELIEPARVRLSVFAPLPDEDQQVVDVDCGSVVRETRRL